MKVSKVAQWMNPSSNPLLPEKEEKVVAFNDYILNKIPIHLFV